MKERNVSVRDNGTEQKEIKKDFVDLWLKFFEHYKTSLKLNTKKNQRRR